VPFTLQVLIGLVLGLAGGIAMASSDVAWVRAVPGMVEPAGTLFINAIRMTVIPLVVASLMLGVGSTRKAGAVGRIGLRAFALFLVVLTLSALFSLALGYPLFDRLVIDPQVAEKLRSGATSGQLVATTGGVPSLTEWVLSLVPVNPFKAAADGAMLPLIVFSVAFGLALGRVKDAARAAMLSVLEAIADACLVLVGWVLRLAPVGVFALAMPLGTRMGADAAGALAYYIVVMSGISAAFIVFVLGPAAVLLGGQRAGAFARAIAPAVAVAFTSRSSLAALPASFEAIRTRLKLPDEIATVYLPLSAAVFRAGGTIAQVLGVLFVAKLYGIPLGAAQLGTIVVAAIATTFTIPGIPAGAIIVIAPVLASVGVPVEGIGLLIGVDTIPDMFRTSANVVGWLAGACILGRHPAEPVRGAGES
jgi:Na+/H+-dicarboxylate symporter